MEIKETIKRECCQQQDLRPYRGLVHIGYSSSIAKLIQFCIHCGQARIKDSNREPGFEKPDMLFQITERTINDTFIKHLDKASEIVKTWPEFKQQLLSNKK